MAGAFHRTRAATSLIQRQPIRLRRPENRRGRTRHFAVYVDPALGPDGAKDADVVLEQCEADYAKISTYFGGLKAGPFNVILFHYPSGAYHNDCDAIDLFCHAKTRPARGIYSEFLNVMEFVEVFEAKQGKGWDCGKSNGEALSRVLGTVLHPRETTDFATASSWLDSTRRNYVDNTSGSDTGSVANGCSVLFLNWLHHQLKHPWPRIVAAGAPTLGQTYTKLTGKTDGFIQFKALIDAHFPIGRKSRLKTDNPFPL
jgi:hypothetical protein